MKKLQEKVFQVFMIGMLMVINMQQAVFAAAAGDDTTGIEKITKPFDILKILTLSIIGSIGTIMAAWALFEIGSSLYQHDTSQIGTSLKKLAGGALMAGAAVVLALMGLS